MILCLALASLVPAEAVAAPLTTVADEGGDPGVTATDPSLFGSLEPSRDPASVTGWVATTRRGAIVVEVIVDGAIAARLHPRMRRLDAESVHPGGRVAGFVAEIPSARRAGSVCVVARIRRLVRGIGCRAADPGSFIAAPARRSVAGSRGRVVRYSVSVEARTSLVPDDVGRVVHRVLADGRSWIAEGTHRFRRTAAAIADLHVLVASPATVDRLCAPLATAGRLSCRQGDQVIMNVDRWEHAVPFWTAGLAEYRAYLVNHEVGHYLGHGHRDCPAPGALAPVMQQQTKGLQGCRPNGWPHPGA